MSVIELEEVNRMEINEVIGWFKNNAEYSRKIGDLHGYLHFRQLSEWLEELEAVKRIIADHDNDKLPEDYYYIDRIREVIC